MIKFNEATHSYVSIDPTDTTRWTSVTRLVSNYKQKFDAEKQAAKSVKNKSSKWYKMDPKEVVKIWSAEADRSCNLGNFYHNQRENDLLSLGSITRSGNVLPVFKSTVLTTGEKIAPPQKLEPGIYPEHFVYLKSAGICGQSDYVEVNDNKVYIVDYKTNKEIKKESFKNWEGISQKMSFPLSHLDDCNFNHYSLQLSLYMYMILRHNPKLECGGITIHHITFEEEEDKDENGFPVLKTDSNGDYIVKTVNVINVPYLKDEVINLLKHHVQTNG